MGNSNSKRRAQSQPPRTGGAQAATRTTQQANPQQQLVNARPCEVCVEPAPNAIDCSQGHRVCTECFSNYVEVTWVANTQGHISSMGADNLPEVRCVVPGCTSRPFTMTQVIRHASDSAANAYLDVIQRTKDGQTYAHAQQLLAHAGRGTTSNSNDAVKRDALLQAQLQAQIGGNSLQCPKCNFGPVEMTGCADLAAYHNNGFGNNKVRNQCPNCGFHSANRSAWKTWDGTLPAAALAVLPGKKPPSPPQRTRALTAGTMSSNNLNALRPRAATTSGPKNVSFSGPNSGGFTPTLANLGPDVYDPALQAMTQRLTKFYNVYDRDRLVKVPEIVDRYRPEGEAELFSRLVSKYGPEPGTTPPQPPVAGGIVQMPPPNYFDPNSPHSLSRHASNASLGQNPSRNNSFHGGGGSRNNSFHGGSFTVSSPMDGTLGPLNDSFGSISSPPSGGGFGKYGATILPPPAAGPPAATLHPGGNGAPLKYIKGNDGIRRINPEYLTYHQRRNPTAHDAKAGSVARVPVTSTSVLYPRTALAVCSSMDEYGTYFQDAPLHTATDDAISKMQEHPQVTQRVGLEPDTMTDELGKILAKYEAPIGMMPKLMCLSDFELLEFIVDDSGSMNLDSDVRTRHGGSFLTRWEEVKARMETMFEILSCVPTPPISIVFLNRRDKVLLRRDGVSQSPAHFIAEAQTELNRVWARDAEGRTPAFEAIKRSFLGRESQSVARYFFGDGEPNGGRPEEQMIGRYMKTRKQPQRNPFTFMSCTDNDAQTEWMKDVEEIAPFCAEYDDFLAEAREVARDHGNALPYSLGMHLVGQLVGALNPNDLDALDESVPLTKGTLDNLLGYRHSEQEYRHYFTNFTTAQRARVIRTPADRLRKDTKWDPSYQLFVTAAVAADIRVVGEYQLKLRDLAL